LYSNEITVQIEKDKQTVILDYQNEIQEKIGKIAQSNQKIIKELENKKASIEKSIADTEKQITQLENPFHIQINKCEKSKDKLLQEYEKFRERATRELKTGKGKNYNRAIRKADETFKKYEDKQLECDNIKNTDKKEKKNNESLIESKKLEIKKYNKKLTELNEKISNPSSLDNVLEDKNSSIPPSILKEGKSSYNKALEVKEKLFKDNEQYRHQHWIYMLFIFTIEILPIITKLLAQRGSYDSEMAEITFHKSLEHDKNIEEAKLKAKSHIQKEALKYSSECKMKETEYKKELNKKKNEPWFREG